MENQEEIVVTQEEFEQFAKLQEKISRFKHLVEKPLESAQEHPTLIDIGIDFTLIKEGQSIVVADSVLANIKTNFQIPIDKEKNYEELINKILSRITETIEQSIKEELNG